MGWWEAEHGEPAWYVDAMLERARADRDAEAGADDEGGELMERTSSAPDTLESWR